MVIDGTFPTVESPNPENPEGFYLAVDLAKKTAATSSSAPTRIPTAWASWCETTPDDYRPVTGNQTGVLLLDYIIGACDEKRHPAGKSRGAEEHRHHGDGPEVAERKRRPCSTTPSPASNSWPSAKPSGSRGEGISVISSPMRNPTAT
jgi:hypothetical protein